MYNIPKFVSKLILCGPITMLLGISAAHPAWNNPYPSQEAGANVMYSSFKERPKHLDPARAYSADEYSFIAQIYEPPLQYHFLRRPYELIPLTARGMPSIRYLDKNQVELANGAATAAIAFSVYEVTINSGIQYQPHPALARDSDGLYRYHQLTEEQVSGVYKLSDLTYSGTRELTAYDYVYQIKRIADPAGHSPIASLMARYIVGFDQFSEVIKTARREAGKAFIDLREYPLSGVSAVDRYTYRVLIKGKYPQFLFWLAMPFFAPMPWEAEKFYAQPGLSEKNIALDWYPVGTGPFYLAENNPNLRMVLVRNPNFHGETYPSDGAVEDKAAGLLQDAGGALPFIDRAVFSLEKEAIPRWNKFLQGYFDDSGISSDSFDQAVRFNAQGDATVTEQMQSKGINLSTAVDLSIYYMGFNMLDDVIGGKGDRARKLRRAIAIAVDFEEFISIFANGRGIPAQGPIPPGIFGARTGRDAINPYVYDWVDGRPKRKSIGSALRLMREAGFVGGVDTNSGIPLSLHFEAVARGPDDQARLNWMRKQFDKLGIQLIVRSTDYNRFRDKMLKGTGQIFFWGWNADYPDPENFLFLLYGPDAKAIHNGENASNYQNPDFDSLFDKMKNMDNSPRRQALIDRMIDIVRRDSPWIWGFHPKSFSLHHGWLRNVKPNLMANNTLKYNRINAEQRRISRQSWNRPVWWPLVAAAALLSISVIPAVVSFRRRQRRAAL